MATENSSQRKPIHSLILDTGPLIKNTVSISTIINSAEELYTTPAILSEIRDEATRSRVQTTLVPFLKIRNPSPASYDAVIAFSKKTGDHSVLSRQDLGILALAYEIHCERNGGNYGLREAPQQALKRKSGQEPTEQEADAAASQVEENTTPAEEDGWSQPRGKRAVKAKNIKVKRVAPFNEPDPEEVQLEQNSEAISPAEDTQAQGGVAITQDQIIEQESLAEAAAKDASSANAQTETVDISPSQVLSAEENIKQEDLQTPKPSTAQEHPEITNASVPNESHQNAALDDIEEQIDSLNISSSSQLTQQPTPPATDSSDSDSDGDWITPSNLGAHQAKDSGEQSTARTAADKQLHVATMTIDFAMQNVLLQMNLTLLSTNMQRIKKLSAKVLRCHACFNICKQMDKQFCPRCGQSTLQRVSCSTNAKGEFRIHLSRNYQWNKRGDKYSVPKPIAGTANGKWSGQGGGKGGWGRDLILAEDQKEYQKQVDQDKRNKTRDLMDEDYLPGILTGDRGRAGGRPKVGAGKNVNARKRV